MYSMPRTKPVHTPAMAAVTVHPCQMHPTVARPKKIGVSHMILSVIAALMSGQCFVHLYR